MSTVVLLVAGALSHRNAFGVDVWHSMNNWRGASVWVDDGTVGLLIAPERDTNLLWFPERHRLRVKPWISLAPRQLVFGRRDSSYRPSPPYERAFRWEDDLTAEIHADFSNWWLFDVGFAKAWEQRRLWGDEYRVDLSVWFVAAVTGLLSACMWFAPARQRWLRTHCKCGYSLVGLASDVCPECGAPVTGARSSRRRS